MNIYAKNPAADKQNAQTTPVPTPLSPQELEKLIESTVTAKQSPQRTTGSLSSFQEALRKEPQENGSDEKSGVFSPSKTQNNPTLDQKRREFQTSISAYRANVMKKGLKNLTDDELSDFLAINIAENFKLNPSDIEEFMKSGEFKALASTDAEAEKLYKRAIELLRHNLGLEEKKESPTATPPLPRRTENAAMPPLPPKPSHVPIPKPAPAPLALPPKAPPLREDGNARELFRKKTRELIASLGGKKFERLAPEEKLRLMARLVAERYDFSPEKIKRTLLEVRENFTKEGKAMPPQEKEYAEKSILLIEEEISGKPPKENPTQGSIPAPLPQKDTKKYESDIQPLSWFLEELTRQYARGGILTPDEYYSARKIVQEALRTGDPLSYLAKASGEPLFQKTLSAEALRKIEASLAKLPKKDPLPNIPPPPPPTPATRTESRKESGEELLWKTAEKKLADRFGTLFANLKESERMCLIIAAKEQPASSPFGAREHLSKIIDRAEMLYTTTRSRIEDHNRTLYAWQKNNPREILTEEKISELLNQEGHSQIHHGASSAIEHIPLEREGSSKEPIPELILSRKENEIRMLYSLTPQQYLLVQKTKIKNLPAGPPYEKLAKLCNEFGARDKEIGLLTVRQFINKEIECA